MKYRDYLILPVLLMYLIYTSCAFVARVDETGEKRYKAPAAKVDPANIVWGDDEASTGELWYADGVRGAAYFAVNDSQSDSPVICFYGSSNNGKQHSLTESSYVIRNRHLQCINDGVKYDFVFPDEMTAYEILSGVYYQRADSDQIKSQLTSGKFISESNPDNFYILKENGKIKEYSGVKVFNGKWSMNTTDTLVLVNNSEKDAVCVDILCDSFGNISGFDIEGMVYTLAA